MTITTNVWWCYIYRWLKSGHFGIRYTVYTCFITFGRTDSLVPYNIHFILNTDVSEFLLLERFFKPADTHTDSSTLCVFTWRISATIIFCTHVSSLLAVFLSQIKNTSHGIAFTGIVLDIGKVFYSLLQAKRWETAVYKTLGLYRSCLSGNTRMMNASALKWHIPIFCETKSNTRLT